MATAHQCDICKGFFTRTSAPEGTIMLGAKRTRTSNGKVVVSPITGKPIYEDTLHLYDICPSCLDSITIHCSALRHQATKGEKNNG